jgi:hypothetical protein
MRHIRFGFLLVVALLVAACEENHDAVVSIYPLFSDATTTFEPGLIGVWKSNEGDLWTFQQTPNSKTYQLSITDAEGKENWKLDAALVRLAGFSYLDVMSDDSGITGAPAHMLFRMRLGDGAADIVDLDHEWMAKAVSEETQFPFLSSRGKLVIMAPTADLQNFFQRHALDTGAFPETDVTHLTRQGGN